MDKTPVIPFIYLVTGKGGVGKSSVASALAMAQSQKGQRVLLVEFGDSSYNSLVYDKTISIEPVQIQENLELALWNGEDCLREFITHIIKIERVVNLFFDNKVMKTFIRAAPALKELALLGKLTSAQRSYGPKMNYDVIVVDAYSSGHFLSLLRVPKGMGEAIKFGPMGDQSLAIDKVLRNDDLCKILVVTLPEELPVQETIEMIDVLKSEFGKSSQLIINKFLDPPIQSQEPISDQDQEGPLAYLKQKLKTQVQAIEKLRANGLKGKKLDFVFKVEVRERLLALSQQLDDV